MKKLLPYIMVFAVITLATTIMAVVFVFMRPPPAVVAVVAVRADSSAKKILAPRMYGPTLKDLQAGDSAMVAVPLPKSGDSSIGQQLALKDERITPAQPAGQLRAVMDSSQKATAAADSSQVQQRKSMAKVLENMDPTSAARILIDFPDGEIKTCLLTMKKRQAAKILAAFQPDRAARIMR